MTQFRIKDENDLENPEFFASHRNWYKMLITRLDKEGQLFRTGVQYEHGEPIKTLTVLRKRQ